MRRLALILHAHLPWVREPQPWSSTERWFHEAMWECYLPLLDWLERTDAALTISVSPPLAAMMRDGVLGQRLGEHLSVLADLNRALAPSAELHAHYATRLAEADASRQRSWLTRFTALRRVERITTSVTHAFLPALAPVDGVRAQLELGRACWSTPGTGVWLPECAWSAEIDHALAVLDVGVTVLAEHGLALARPRVAAHGLVSDRGVTYIGRSRQACLRVWSRDHGYPGHHLYRDFYRDIGFDDVRLDPLSQGGMTGLKYHRITSRNMGHEQPYEPDRAMEQVERDAADFVAGLMSTPLPTVVAAFDAELFGHWWHEGLLFLDAVLQRLRAAGIELVTLSSLADEALPVAEPTSSTWGRGGFSRDWVNPATARCWRDIHNAHRELVDSVQRFGHVVGVRGAALDHAIDATLGAEASDWLYMISQREHAGYAERRLAEHLRMAERMREIAGGAVPGRADEVAIRSPRTVTDAVSSETLRRCITSR